MNPPSPRKVELFDTSLRDGLQQPNLDISVPNAVGLPRVALDPSEAPETPSALLSIHKFPFLEVPPIRTPEPL
jgi:hypothetical protein